MGQPTLSCSTVMRPILLFSAVLGALTSSQSFGPVSLDTLDPLTLSWNQIHWLVKDQIKEVEELKKEHDTIYNEITGCFGLEKCLNEFDLLRIEPGSKLYELGLRKESVRMELIRQREEEVETAKHRLEAELRERERQREYLEMQRQQEERRQELERKRIEADRQREEERIELLQSQRQKSSNFYSSSSISRSSTSSGSSRWTDSVDFEPGLSDNSWRTSSTFTNSSVFGPKPTVYERRYEYSSSRKYGPYPTRQN